MITSTIKGIFNISKRCYAIATPYGRRKLARVLITIIGNGALQIVGVTSIVPFLALAANPQSFRNSGIGIRILSILPPMSDQLLLMWTGIVSILLLLLSNGVALASELSRNRYVQGLGHHLRKEIMTSFCHRPYTFFTQKNSSQFLRKILAEVNNLVSGVIMPLIDSCSRVVTIISLALLIVVAQPGVAIIGVVFILFFYFSIFLALRQKLTRLGEERKANGKALFTTALQYFNGIKPIIVHDKGTVFVDRFLEHSLRHSHLASILPTYGNVPRMLVEPIAFGGLIAAVVWLAFKGDTLTDILPSLGLMALAGYRILPSIQQLYANATQISATAYTIEEAENELKNAAGFQAASHTTELPRPTFNRAIRINSITFRYPGTTRKVFDSFSCELLKNSSVGIIGTTGCGKSTLVDILLGLHFVESGDLKVDDVSLNAANFPAWRSGIGYVPQDIFLIDASIADNIAFGIPPNEQNIEQLRRAAKSAQILDAIESEFQEGWNTQVGERGVRLSGGQKQRIGLARALYHQPDLLILDEATSALDHETEAEVMRAISELQGSVTMIMIAHRLTTVSGCDKIIDLGALRDGHANASVEKEVALG